MQLKATQQGRARTAGPAAGSRQGGAGALRRPQQTARPAEAGGKIVLLALALVCSAQCEPGVSAAPWHAVSTGRGVSTIQMGTLCHDDQIACLFMPSICAGQQSAVQTHINKQSTKANQLLVWLTSSSMRPIWAHVFSTQPGGLPAPGTREVAVSQSARAAAYARRLSSSRACVGVQKRSRWNFQQDGRRQLVRAQRRTRKTAAGRCEFKSY